MRIAKRDLKLLLVLAGLLVFLLLYMLVFNNFQAKTDAVNLKITELEAEVQELENHYLRLAEYEEGIKTGRDTVRKELETFPADVKEEDILSYLLTMESREDIHMESVTFNSPILLRQFDAVLPQGDENIIVPAEVFCSSTLMTASMTYPQAKNVIDYLYESAKQTTLDSVALAYTPETGKLTGSYKIAKYYIQYPDAEYTPERIPAASLGVKDLFGTT